MRLFKIGCSGRLGHITPCHESRDQTRPSRAGHMMAGSSNAALCMTTQRRCSTVESRTGSAILSQSCRSLRRRYFRLDLDGFAPILSTMSVGRELRPRLRADQIQSRFGPCLPRAAEQPPVGPGWIHEIKHDGFRILAHRLRRAIRLMTRNGHDLADRFPRAAEAVAALPVRSCVIDAEAIVCDDSGLAVFDLIRGHGRNGRAILCAFDLLEVNGGDVRAEPIEDRKHRLTGLLAPA
jgi:ATP-dependent DNA ligase